MNLSIVFKLCIYLALGASFFLSSVCYAINPQDVVVTEEFGSEFADKVRSSISNFSDGFFPDRIPTEFTVTDLVIGQASETNSARAFEISILWRSI